MTDIKLIGFDLNGTLIPENTWLNLNLAMGMTQAEDSDLLRLYETGQMSYRECQKRIETLYLKRGRATERAIEKIIAQYDYNDGVEDVIRYLGRKYHLALISGSMDVLVNRVADELGIKHRYSNNTLVFRNGRLVRIDVSADDSDFKVQVLTELSGSLGLSLFQCAYVGDSSNDLKIFTATGRGITFSGSPIEKTAWKIILSLQELKEIL